MFRKKVKVIEKPCKKGKAGKVALAVLGVGIVTGATLVFGMSKIVDNIFVDEDWDDEEWTTEDWAEEDVAL